MAMSVQGALQVLPQAEAEPLFGRSSPARQQTWLRLLSVGLLAPVLLLLPSLSNPLPILIADPAAQVGIDRSTGLSPLTALKLETVPDKTLPIDPNLAIVVNAKRPFDGALEAVAPFRFTMGGLDQERAIGCLAAAAWFEAGDDPVGGRAVIQVVLNRARHPSYPKTVCGVVFEGSERRTGCQFTFTCDGALARTPSPAAWARARALAAQALAGVTDTTVGAATHYHADYVVPRWAPKLDKLAQIGAHIFYRFPGSWGRKAVFLNAGNRSEPVIAKLARFSPAHGDGVTPAEIVAEAMPLTDDVLNSQANAASSLVLQRPDTAVAAADTALMMVASVSEPPGRWAIKALAECQGRPDCQVLAWSSEEAVAANRLRPAADRERPAFLFVRDRSSGMEVALWDCHKTPRPNATQCLPDDPAALRRLMRQR